MKQYLTTFRAILTGELKGHKDLKRGFPIFNISLILIWTFTFYNASMSYLYYRYNAGTLPFAEELAGLVTGIIAIFIVFLGVYVIDYVQDWYSNRDMGSRSSGTFVTATMLYFLLMGWDIFVNHGGIMPAAQVTTKEIIADDSERIGDKYNAEILTLKKELAGLYHSYYWCSKHKTRHKTHNPQITGKPYIQSLDVPASACPHEAFWFGPGAGKSTIDHNRDKEKIALAEAKIEKEMGIRTQAVSSAQTKHSNDTDRYENEIKTKSGTHRVMIWISYVLIFICSWFNQVYNNRIGDFLDGVQAPTNPNPRPKTGKAKKGLFDFLKKPSASAGVTTGGHIVVDPVDNSNTEGEDFNGIPTPSSGQSDLIPKANANGITAEQMEDIMSRHMRYKNQPPRTDNTGKTYKKRTSTPVSGNRNTRVSAPDIIQSLAAFKRQNTQATKADAVEAFKGQIGRSSIYKYWDNA